MKIQIPAGMAWWANYRGMEEFPDTCSHKIFCSFWYVGPNPEVLPPIFGTFCIPTCCSHGILDNADTKKLMTTQRFKTVVTV